MSRLNSMSANAIKAMFDIESSDTLITLLTIKADSSIGIPSDIRLTDTATQRLSETSEDVMYGTISNSLEYIFLPFEIVLPNDDNNAAPKCAISIHDVTRILLPTIRTINGPPEVVIQLVLSSTPNVIELSYSGFKLTSIKYDSNTISADLTMPSLEVEPFPLHSFTPAYFPGLF